MAWKFSFDVPPVQEWNPAQGDVTHQHGFFPTDLIQYQKGQGPSSPADAGSTLFKLGWTQCPNQNIANSGRPCGYWISPTVKAKVEQGNGYFTCPRCKLSFDLLDGLPWHGPVDGDEQFAQEFKSGGGTRIGIPMQDQAQIAENLIAKMGEIPGYGPITWWHPGGAVSQSPLDGAVKEWGLEIKAIGYDSTHHRFIPGDRHEKNDKNRQAQEMGLKGVLGVLVMLDYRRDLADIYVKEMPLEPWEFVPGRFTQGVSTFRKDSAQKLVAEVPFESPYKDPSNPNPKNYAVADYYQSPSVIDPHQSPSSPSEPMPF